MNILFLVKDMEYSNGGVCTQILTLAREYIYKGHRAILIAEGTDFLSQIKEAGIIYIDYIKMKSIRFNPKSFINAYNSIKSIVKEYAIDIIHVHTQSALPIAFILHKKTGVPFLWTNHIDDIPHPFVLKQFHRFMKFPIISVSNSCKNDLVDRFDIKPNYIKVIPNGIKLEDFEPLSPEERNAFRERFGIDSNLYNICILSRVAKNKGQDLLVRAIDLVQQNKKIPPIQLLIAGNMQEKEWYETEVLEYANKHNVVLKYIGFQLPREVFGVADLFVLPSRKEGFGMVCIEALAMKCPVVRSNSPGWDEMEEYCRVVNIGDIESLANEIEAAYIKKEETERITLNGYRAVHDRFNSTSMAKSTILAYTDVINRNWP